MCGGEVCGAGEELEGVLLVYDTYAAEQRTYVSSKDLSQYV